MTVGTAEILEQHWPSGGLEPVERCPLCQSARRSLMHADLTDRIFFAAPGKWSLWECRDCRSAYLDPRPTEETIGLAYGRYYTHDDGELPSPTTAFQRLRAGLGNGYRNRRFGTRFAPALPLGGLIGALVPPLAWPVNVAYRFLPPPAAGPPRRVLDIGCGSGAWLRMARDAGWQVAGVEPDPGSSKLACAHGIDVRPSIGDWLSEAGGFDFATLSHVIEHVHDPLQLLREVHALLRPGGGIYVDTPNISALGHRIYGRNWRGLEPPRHLVIFNRRNLTQAIQDAGFRDIRYRPRFPFAGMSEQSRRIVAGLDPYGEEDSRVLPPPPGLLTRLRSALSRNRREFLTLTATRD